MSVIRAEVLSSSSDDKYARVKVKSEGYFKESPLLESVNGLPLKPGDNVYVDITDGLYSALILGKSRDVKSPDKDGSILFESSNGSEWTISYVKNDKFYIENSSGVKIEITGSELTFNTLNPSGQGPFCTLPTCMYSGITHTTNKISK